MLDTNLNVILDSGAYTAWRSGNPINLENYIRFIKDNEEWAGKAACLDVINPGDPEAAAAASMINYKIMRKEGIKAIPIFHVGEDERWLKEMLDLGADYIGLSASSIASRNQVDPWYDMIWSHLVDASGLPLVRCHAFGEGREASLRAFPWFSADSASWIYTAQRSATMKIGGKRISHRNDHLSTRAALDIDALAGADRVEWDRLLAERGLTHEAFTRDIGGHVIRTYIEARNYIDMQNRINALTPIKHKPTGFFCKPYVGHPAISIPEFNMHLVIGTNGITRAVLTMIPEIKNVLISYAYLANRKWYHTLKEYFADPKRVAESDPFLARYVNIVKEHLAHVQ